MNLKTVSIITLSVLFAGTFLFAGCRPGPGHGRKGPDPKRILKHMDKKVNDLELNDSQQVEYLKIRKAIEADMDILHKERRETGAIIKAELDRKNPDMKKIAGIFKQGREKHESYMDKYMDMFLDFYKKLNPDQQKKVIDEMKKRMEKHGRRPRPRN